MSKLQADFRMVGEDFPVTPEAKKAFKELGYIVVRNLLNTEELHKLKTALEGDTSLLSNSYKRDDGHGTATKVTIWTHPGSDITGTIARSEKVAGTFEQLFGEEVYHYHAKVIHKDAKTGGKFVWHQDYGYWYHNGCLRPDMGTVFIAVDKASKENGCLQIIEGSHQLGRVDHVTIGEKVGVDPQRMEDILAHASLPHSYAELEPGDAIFFHCNVLHTSAQNKSDARRWAYLMCYNTARNNPTKVHHHALYTPLEKVPNSAILECDTVLRDKGKLFYSGNTTKEELLLVQQGTRA